MLKFLLIKTIIGLIIALAYGKFLSSSEDKISAGVSFFIGWIIVDFVVVLSK